MYFEPTDRLTFLYIYSYLFMFRPTTILVSPYVLYELKKSYPQLTSWSLSSRKTKKKWKTPKKPSCQVWKSNEKCAKNIYKCIRSVKMIWKFACVRVHDVYRWASVTEWRISKKKWVDIAAWDIAFIPCIIVLSLTGFVNRCQLRRFIAVDSSPWGSISRNCTRIARFYCRVHMSVEAVFFWYGVGGVTRLSIFLG